MDIRGRTTPALNMVLFSIVFPHVPECFVVICVIQGFFVPGQRNAPTMTLFQSWTEKPVRRMNGQQPYRSCLTDRGIEVAFYLQRYEYPASEVQ